MPQPLPRARSPAGSGIQRGAEEIPHGREWRRHPHGRERRFSAKTGALGEIPFRVRNLRARRDPHGREETAPLPPNQRHGPPAPLPVKPREGPRRPSPAIPAALTELPPTPPRRAAARWRPPRRAPVVRAAPPTPPRTSPAARRARSSRLPPTRSHRNFRQRGGSDAARRRARRAGHGGNGHRIALGTRGRRGPEQAHTGLSVTGPGAALPTALCPRWLGYGHRPGSPPPSSPVPPADTGGPRLRDSAQLCTAACLLSVTAGTGPALPAGGASRAAPPPSGPPHPAPPCVPQKRSCSGALGRRSCPRQARGSPVRR